MKKLCTLLYSLIVATAANAGVVTKQQALQKAQQFLEGRSLTTASKARALKPSDQAAGEGQAYYVFNVEGDGGFVIVSADDRTEEILGYSEHGNLGAGPIPDNLRWWLDWCKKSILSLQAQPTTRAAGTQQAVRRASKPEIAPMITTQWGQDEPYNLQCPTDGERYCKTGCVATAMSQIINYHKYPASVEPLTAYTTSNRLVPDIDGITFDWENMGDSAVAALMRYCGQTVRMQYGYDASGTSEGNIPIALINRFGYDQGVHVVHRNGYSAETWDNMMYDELKNGRPILYSGHSTTGGHAFICHGYKDDRYYVNWGFDGRYDGYYVMALMDMPSSGDGFHKDQSAVIGIQRPTFQPYKGYKSVTLTNLHLTSQSEISKTVNTGMFSIHIDWQFNTSILEKKSIMLGFALFQGNDMKELLYEVSISFQPGGYFDMIHTNLRFGKSLPDGTYYLKGIYKENESGEWRTAEGSNYRYIKAVISRDHVIMTAYPDEGDGPGDPAYKEDEVDNINFTDNAVRKICVANWDTNEDGHLSFEEAANVADIGDKFKGSNVKNLNDLQYFTGLRSISNGAFQNCKSLESIIIPKNVSSLGYKRTFANCESLKSIRVANGNNVFDSRDNCNAVVYTMMDKLVAGCSETQIPGTVKSIGALAFASNASLTSVVIPESVKTIEDSAFAECPNIVTVYSYNEKPGSISENVFSVYDTATLHVPYKTKNVYQATDGWNLFNHIQQAPGGDDITITANSYAREYGDENPTLDYTVSGGTADGIPTLTCDALVTSPVGEYAIQLGVGDVMNENVTLADGILTITKAPLVISVGDYTATAGSELPDFSLTYSGFKNGDTEEVLTVKPTVTCIATPDSEPGEYDVIVEGAEAENYDITYENGKLVTTSGIRNIVAEDKSTAIYNIHGYKVSQNGMDKKNLPQGIYIICGKKKLVK